MTTPSDNEGLEAFDRDEDDDIALPGYDELLKFLDSPENVYADPAPVEPSAERRQTSAAMVAGAVALFELYTAYVDAGFSSYQSLQLCISILTSGLK